MKRGPSLPAGRGVRAGPDWLRHGHAARRGAKAGSGCRGSGRPGNGLRAVPPVLSWRAAPGAEAAKAPAARALLRHLRRSSSGPRQEARVRGGKAHRGAAGRHCRRGANEPLLHGRAAATRRARHAYKGSGPPRERCSRCLRQVGARCQWRTGHRPGRPWVPSHLFKLADDQEANRAGAHWSENSNEARGQAHCLHRAPCGAPASGSSPASPARTDTASALATSASIAMPCPAASSDSRMAR